MEQRRIPVAPGVELAVDVWDAPDGVPFVLVHGLASNARLWDGVAAELSAHGHRVAAVDLRGHGRSDKPDDGFDFETVTRDVLAVLDGLGYERPIVVGQSWGADVVMELAARAPGRALGIACVDGGWSDLQSRFPDWDDCAAALAPPRLVGLPATSVETRIRQMHPTWPASGIAGTMANFEIRADGTIAPWLTFERHMRILRELWGHHPAELFAQVRVPVLLLPADTGDGAWTAEKRAAVSRADASLARARTQWFSPADHDVHAQHPVEVAAALTSALDDGFFA